jgi:nucleoside-diphosphate-sugar epimerase
MAIERVLCRDCSLLLATHPGCRRSRFQRGHKDCHLHFQSGQISVADSNADIQVKFSHKSWAGDIHTLVPTVDRMTALGFKPRFSLESGLQRLVEWFSDTSDQSAPVPT